jgi:uncharacterized RmlC-like cupin family protein
MTHGQASDQLVDWREQSLAVPLTSNTPQSPGMARAASTARRQGRRRRLWAGTVTIHPNAKTGAHHHGDLESVIFVVKGRARMRWGENLEYVAEAGAGDCIYVPPYVPHQEIQPQDRSTLMPVEGVPGIAAIHDFCGRIVSEHHGAMELEHFDMTSNWWPLFGSYMNGHERATAVMHMFKDLVKDKTSCLCCDTELDQNPAVMVIVRPFGMSLGNPGAMVCPATRCVPDQGVSATMARSSRDDAGHRLIQKGLG